MKTEVENMLFVSINLRYPLWPCGESHMREIKPGGKDLHRAGRMANCWDVG